MNNGIILHYVPANLNKPEGKNDLPVGFSVMPLTGDLSESQAKVKTYFTDIQAEISTALKYGLKPFSDKPEYISAENLLNMIKKLLVTCHARNFYLIGYSFDSELKALERQLESVLDFKFPEFKKIDLFKLAQTVLKYSETGGWSQANVAYALGVKPFNIETLFNKSEPRLNNETEIDFIILKEMAKKFNCRTLDDIYELQNNPPFAITELPFGKYAGDKIKDIVKTDISYMGWLATKGTADFPVLQECIKAAIKIQTNEDID